MANQPASSLSSREPTETVQRRPTDMLWFAVLFLSIATGIGMTIFAPVGDDPPPTVSATLPALPTTTEAATQPATSPATSPATLPVQ